MLSIADREKQRFDQILLHNSAIASLNTLCNTQLQSKYPKEISWVHINVVNCRSRKTKVWSNFATQQCYSIAI